MIYSPSGTVWTIRWISSMCASILGKRIVWNTAKSGWGPQNVSKSRRIWKELKGADGLTFPVYSKTRPEDEVCASAYTASACLCIFDVVYVHRVMQRCPSALKLITAAFKGGPVQSCMPWSIFCLNESPLFLEWIDFVDSDVYDAGV